MIDIPNQHACIADMPPLPASSLPSPTLRSTLSRQGKSGITWENIRTGIAGLFGVGVSLLCMRHCIAINQYLSALPIRQMLDPADLSTQGLKGHYRYFESHPHQPTASPTHSLNQYHTLTDLKNMGCLSVTCYHNFTSITDFGHCQLVMQPEIGFDRVIRPFSTDMRCRYRAEQPEDIIIDPGPLDYRYRNVSLWERFLAGRIEILSADWDYRHMPRERPSAHSSLGTRSRLTKMADFNQLIAHIDEINAQYDASWSLFGYNCVPAVQDMWTHATDECLPDIDFAWHNLLTPETPNQLLKCLKNPKA